MSLGFSCKSMGIVPVACPELVEGALTFPVVFYEAETANQSNLTSSSK